MMQLGACADGDDSQYMGADRDLNSTSGGNSQFENTGGDATQDGNLQTGGSGSGATFGSGSAFGSGASVGSGSSIGSGAASGSGAANGSGGDGSGAATSTGPQVRVYLLFGQSNMWGVPASEPADRVQNQRVEVLTLSACGNHGANQWVQAAPPLHGCVGSQSGNPGVGPGDSFGRKMAEAYPQDTILLVPGAIPGVSIDQFARNSATYNSILERAAIAQERGEIRGILFHQGESDSGSDTWLSRVNAVVSGLREDLNLQNVPFVAAELPYTGCCGNLHNPIIAQIPQVIADSYVVNSSGLGIMNDGLHFDAPAQRALGERYAELFLGLE